MMDSINNLEFHFVFSKVTTFILSRVDKTSQSKVTGNSDKYSLQVDHREPLPKLDFISSIYRRYVPNLFTTSPSFIPSPLDILLQESSQARQSKERERERETVVTYCSCFSMKEEMSINDDCASKEPRKETFYWVYIKVSSQQLSSHSTMKVKVETYNLYGNAFQQK